MFAKLLAALNGWRRRSPARAPAPKVTPTARELILINPLAPGGPFPAARCARCVHAESGARPAHFRERLIMALDRILSAPDLAVWLGVQIDAGRLCGYRVERVLFRARMVADGGCRLSADLARAYMRGELLRLAVKCGLEPPAKR